MALAAQRLLCEEDLNSRTERPVIDTDNLFDDLAGFCVSYVSCIERPVYGEGKLKTFENVPFCYP